MPTLMNTLLETGGLSIMGDGMETLQRRGQQFMITMVYITCMSSKVEEQSDINFQFVGKAISVAPSSSFLE
jgi:hypothetical protein